MLAGNFADLIASFDKIKKELGHPAVLIYNAGPGVQWPPPGKCPSMAPVKQAPASCVHTTVPDITPIASKIVLLLTQPASWGTRPCPMLRVQSAV